MKVNGNLGFDESLTEAGVAQMAFFLIKRNVMQFINHFLQVHSFDNFLFDPQHYLKYYPMYIFALIYTLKL